VCFESSGNLLLGSNSLSPDPISDLLVNQMVGYQTLLYYQTSQLFADFSVL